MTKASEYGISVRLVIRDGEEMFEARVAELQDVIAFGDTYNEAYESVIEAVTGIQEMFADKGKSLPPPEQEISDFSGRITFRMSKSLHQCVHASAARDGISLNQWILEAVAYRVHGRMVHADSVMVASKVRDQVTGGIGIKFLQTQHVGSFIANAAGAPMHVVAIPGTHEAAGFQFPIVMSGIASGRGVYHG